MFGYQQKRQPEAAVSDYDGEGIWLGWPGCGKAHERLNDPDFEALLLPVSIEVGDTSREVSSLFGINNPDARWTVLPEDGLFKFTQPDGRAATGRYGVIGSWNETTHGWLWAWGFPESWNMPDACLAPARDLRDRAEANGWRAATTRTLKVNEAWAWHLTSLAAHVRGFAMVYRARVNDLNYHYFAIDRLHWTN